MGKKNLSTQNKALQINLDPHKYGAFAEIGAGQEVVRWFFQVGGAAGTIAKSMSAYDMTVSDAIYGHCDRYVSQQRLDTMIEHDYDLLVQRLNAKRGNETDFFVFADTVSARNFLGTNECHAWMGIKFQTSPHSEPNQIIIHVQMLDKDNLLQQQALGIVGVNLIYAALYHYESPDLVIENLLDSLSIERVEIDMIKFSGPEYTTVDHRLMSLKLVQLGLSDAAMFSATGEVLQPSEVLHKKPILVERGSFLPVTYVHLDILESAREQFAQTPDLNNQEFVVLMELTMKSLSETGEIDYQDFLARADMLAATGNTVLISDFYEYYRLAGYLSRYTKERIGLTMGIPSLIDIFKEKDYDNLEGGILESFGRLFKNDLRLYVYPSIDRATGQLMNVSKLKVEPHLQSLFQYLVDNNDIQSLDFYNKQYLSIFSDEVLGKITSKDPTWESMVSPEVAKLIKERGFCGYSG